MGDKPAADANTASASDANDSDSYSESDMATVQAIVQKSKSIQQGKALSGTVSSNSLSTGIDPTALPSSVSGLQSIISRLNQVVLMYQQQMDQKVETLSEQVNAQKQQQNQMAETIKSLSAQQFKLQTMIAQVSNETNQPIASPPTPQPAFFGHFITTYLWLLMAIVLVFLMFMLGS